MADKEDIDGLPDLTPKQMSFVEKVIEGLSKTEAYAQAYNTKNMKRETIQVKASQLSTTDKISVWLEHIRCEAVSKLTTVETYTREAYISELEAIIQLSIANKSYGPALHGICAKGKTCGHVTENHEHKHIHTADTAMLDKIESTMGTEARQRAEEEMGLVTKH